MAGANTTEQAAATHTAPESTYLNLEVTVSLKVPRESFESTLQAAEAVLLQAIEKSFEREQRSFEQLGVRIEKAASYVSTQALLREALFERGFIRCASALTPLIDVFFDGRTLKFLGSHYDVALFKDPAIIQVVKEVLGDGIAVEVDSIQATNEDLPLIKTESATGSK